MDGDSQRAVAVWAILVLPFAIFAGFLYTRNQLTIEVFAVYWFPAVVLTLVGTIPPPWEPLVS